MDDATEASAIRATLREMAADVARLRESEAHVLEENRRLNDALEAMKFALGRREVEQMAREAGVAR